MTTQADQTTKRLVTGVRGKRYGEVLLVSAGQDELLAEVYNSFTLNDCPLGLWNELDAGAIAAEHGAILAVLNGPRYWAMDNIEKSTGGERIEKDFGGIGMTRAATLHLGPGVPDRSPYNERRVNRTALFSFDTGTPTYRLHDDRGRTFVMQAWCTATDDALTEADLAGLGERLTLPAGWSFSVERCREPLVVDTTVLDAIVVQDELQNTYSLIG